MSGVVSGFFIVWAVIGLGYVIGRAGVLGPDGQRVLSKLAFYVASPPLLFTTISEADIHHIFSAPLLVAAASAWLTMIAYALLSRFVFSRDAATVVMGAQAAGQVNAANLGIPIALFVLGDASQVAPVMLFQLAINTPLYLTIMDTLTGGRRPTVGSVLKNIVTNPLIMGSALGIMSAATGSACPTSRWSPCASWRVRPFPLCCSPSVSRWWAPAPWPPPAPGWTRCSRPGPRSSCTPGSRCCSRGRSGSPGTPCTRP